MREPRAVLEEARHQRGRLPGVGLVDPVAIAGALVEFADPAGPVVAAGEERPRGLAGPAVAAGPFLQVDDPVERPDHDRLR